MFCSSVYYQTFRKEKIRELRALVLITEAFSFRKKYICFYEEISKKSKEDFNYD